MAETEGVIKYRLDFELRDCVTFSLDELNVWRNILYGLNLIGQDQSRYLGYGYGNISCRHPQHADQFIITGSQTGGISSLNKRHYVTIECWDIDRNHVTAQGPLPPSSEVLTHAMIYQMNPQTTCVMHAHDPLLWRFGLHNNLPQTAVDIEYGTPQMAQAIETLLVSGQLQDSGLLVMAGHEDGVISFADSIELAGARMLSLWVDSHLSVNR